MRFLVNCPRRESFYGGPLIMLCICCMSKSQTKADNYKGCQTKMMECKLILTYQQNNGSFDNVNIATKRQWYTSSNMLDKSYG